MCELNDPGTWYNDSGIVSDPHYLPMTRVSFGDTGAAQEQAYINLAPLMCYHGEITH